MKRALLLALTMTLLLAGCGAVRRDERLAETRLSALRQMETLSFEAAVTARTEQEELTYTARAQRQGDETQVTLLTPEALAGVSLRCDREGETLCYDGAALYLGGALTAARQSPAGALPLLEQALRQGSLLRARRAGGCLVTELSLYDEIELTLWLLPPALTPCRAELAREGRTVCTMELSDWKEA